MWNIIKNSFKKYKADHSAWETIARSICIKEDLDLEKFQPYSDGSNLVASIDEFHVLKILPSVHKHQWKSEVKSLSLLNALRKTYTGMGAEDIPLSIPVPILLESGKFDDLLYIVMTKVEGDTLESHWPNLNDEQKQNVLFHIGAVMAEVHALPVDRDEIKPRWKKFIKRQLKNYQSRHQSREMPDWFNETVEEFVLSNVHLLPKKCKDVLLTGEYTPFNMLVDEKGNICGMIDFGDAMIGFNEYDFLGPIMFLVSGDKNLLSALFNGYGYPKTRINEKLQRRLMVLQILHRFSDFNTQLRINGWKEKVTSIEQLMQLIFPI